MIPGGGAVQMSPSEEFYNLPLVLAYGVLGEALAQMAHEGMFSLPTTHKETGLATRPLVTTLVRRTTVASRYG